MSEASKKAEAMEPHEDASGLEIACVEYLAMEGTGAYDRHIRRLLSELRASRGETHNP